MFQAYVSGPVFVEAGPQFSYLVSHTIHSSDQRGDVGVALGAGINLPLGLGVGGRFTTSLNIGDYRNSAA